MGDAGEILMGRIGREVLGIGQLLLLIFLMSSHLLTFTILMNTLTNHGTCTTIFGVVGLVICFLGALPRTMEKVYWMSVTCKLPASSTHCTFCQANLFLAFLSIFIATIVTMVSIGVDANGPIRNDIVQEVSFYKGFLAVTNIIFAYSKSNVINPWISSSNCYKLRTPRFSDLSLRPKIQEHSLSPSQCCRLSIP
jgi:uncharacterized membrane protein